MYCNSTNRSIVPVLTTLNIDIKDHFPIRFILVLLYTSVSLRNEPEQYLISTNQPSTVIRRSVPHFINIV